jgi:hypothetical protein
MYNKAKPMPLRFQDADGSAARSLWEQSEAMVAPFTQIFEKKAA